MTHVPLGIPLWILLCATLAGCGEDAAVPTQGEWRGEQVGFFLEAGELSAWSLQGMYCEGADLSGVGSQRCIRVPADVSSTTLTIAGGQFAGSFGELTLAGAFTTPEHVQGTWSLVGQGCCSAQGAWSATLFEALPEPVTPPDAGASPDSGGGGQATPPPTTVADICDRWTADRADLSEPNWSPGADTCAPGDVDEDGRTRVLRQVNLYRALASLPPVELDSEYNALAQACSVLMDANDSINHVPPESWNCYSYEGAKGAGESNLATTPALQAVGLYMGDKGNETTLGHRRWILQNGLGPFGVGSTNGFSCLHVLGSEDMDPVSWTAWPPPGVIPIEASVTLDPVGWSFHSHTLPSLEGATVTVTRGGDPLPVQTWALDGGYGGSEALAFRPEGWSPQADNTYTVTIQGVAAPITYDVTFVNCSQR